MFVETYLNGSEAEIPVVCVCKKNPLFSFLHLLLVLDRVEDTNQNIV